MVQSGKKPESAGIEGVLQDHQGNVSSFFYNPIGINDSNEAKLIAIRRALSLWVNGGHLVSSLIVEGASANDIAWVSGRRKTPWRLIFIARAISLQRQRHLFQAS